MKKTARNIRVTCKENNYTIFYKHIVKGDSKFHGTILEVISGITISKNISTNMYKKRFGFEARLGKNYALLNSIK